MKIAVAKYAVGNPADCLCRTPAPDPGRSMRCRRRTGRAFEYLSLELASTFAPEISRDLNGCWPRCKRCNPSGWRLYADLSRELRLVIQAGTFLTEVALRKHLSHLPILHFCH